jgi:hypothetical protein
VKVKVDICEGVRGSAKYLIPAHVVVVVLLLLRRGGSVQLGTNHRSECMCTSCRHPCSRVSVALIIVVVCLTCVHVYRPGSPSGADH